MTPAMVRLQIAYWVLWYVLSPLSVLTVCGAKWFVDGLHARNARMVGKGLACFAAIGVSLAILSSAMPRR